jgi:predicted nucleotidyltransferase
MHMGSQDRYGLTEAPGASALLPEVVASLRQGLGEELIAVVLFGSRARGEADKASDWDLLVIARHLPKGTFERHLHLKSMVPVPWRGQTAILSRTPEEFESHLASLFLDIALDGVILYDPDAYMAQRLASLKRLIKEQGLRRERMQRDLVWRWQRFPGFDWSLEWEAAQ